MQQAERMLGLLHRQSDLIRELRNLGNRTWNPLHHPEYLLLEIEGNIRIRDIQIQIADRMIHPPGNQNAVMQLNMGEGKSSVIIPLVAASLASGETFTRVIAEKPQLKQMHEMLSSKLGGLINRQIHHLPFNRFHQGRQGGSPSHQKDLPRMHCRRWYLAGTTRASALISFDGS